MEIYAKNKISLLLSLLTAALIIIAAAAGILDPYAYARETYNWGTQAIGQDIANLFFAAPALIITALLAYRGSRRAYYVWGGVLLYLIYTYAIYCFALHFNYLFLAYCVIFGVSFYQLAYFALTEFKKNNTSAFDLPKIPVKTAAIFLIFLAVLFYMLWLKDIIASMLDNAVPQSIQETGLLSNPVHVLDIAILLPAFIITAMLLFNRRYFGLVLTPVMLMFCVLMTIAIGAAVILLGINGFPSDMSLAAIFGILALVSAGILTRFLRSVKKR